MSLNSIAYVGLTHLGLVSAAAAAEKGFRVICFDPDEALVNNLKSSKYPINEPNFDEALHKNKDRILFTSSLEDLKKATLVYIAPDIPTNDAGVSDLGGIRALVSLVAPYLSQDASLIILSQVPPGFTRSLREELENSGVSLDRLYYQVETLVFGIALQRALFPERFILGALDPQKPLDTNFENFLKAFECPLLVMDYESAEFCKICINAFLATTVATTNTLEEVCRKIGAKWRDIIPALRLDKRIGEFAYLSPGLGLSGGNIERDLQTITCLASRYGAHGQVVDACVKNSRHRQNWPLSVFYNDILPHFSNRDVTIGVLGLAYKADTHSTKNSAALKLISQLSGFKVQVYDPLIKELPSSSNSVTFKTSVTETVKNADVVFLMTPWPEFRRLKPDFFLPLMRQKFIVDPYKLLDIDPKALGVEGATYYAFC